VSIRAATVGVRWCLGLDLGGLGSISVHARGCAPSRRVLRSPRFDRCTRTVPLLVAVAPAVSDETGSFALAAPLSTSYALVGLKFLLSPPSLGMPFLEAAVRCAPMSCMQGGSGDEKA